MLNPIEEAKFAELKDKCRELKVPAPPEIFIGLQVHENGVLVFDDKQRGHSWTRNYWNRLYALGGSDAPMAGASFAAGYMTGKSLGGAVSNNLKSTNLVYADSYPGLYVGTGDTAFSVEQFALVSAIANGNGAGQFAHSASSVPAAAYTAGTKTWKTTHYRIFNNNSGGSITVKETGIYSAYASTQFLVERSVLSPTVAVANGAQLTVTYEISMDFSAID